MRRAGPLALAAALALVLAGPAGAQGAKTAVKPSKAQLDSASFNLRVLLSAFQSDKVELPVKNALFACLYENSLSKISDAADKVIAANPGKIDKTNPTQILGVLAGTCGYRPEPGKPAFGTSTPTPTPAPRAPVTPPKPGQGR